MESVTSIAMQRAESVLETLNETFARIEQLDAQVEAWVCLDRAGATGAAREIAGRNWRANAHHYLACL